MDSDILRFFQQIADGVTVTEVAELYQISQPGVSRSLKRLEDEVGTPLLERSGRNLRPTHAGTVFKRHVDASLHALDDGLAAVEELLDPETGTVSLGFQPSLGTWLVPRLIASFRRRNPQVRFRLEHSQDAHGSSLVSGGRTDLEITARRPRDPEVRWERLVRQPLCLAVPPGHRLADHRQVSLGDAAEDQFVMLTPAWDLRSLAEELCAAAGFVPAVTFEENDLQLVRGFVAAGLGVAIVPAPGAGLAELAIGAERLIPLTDPGAFREVGVSWSTQRRLLPSADQFRRHALAVARGGVRLAD